MSPQTKTTHPPLLTREESGLQQTRAIISFKVLQGTPTPTEARVLRLDRAESLESSTEPVVLSHTEIDKEAELELLSKVIRRISNSLPSSEESSEMEEALYMLFKNNLNLESKHGICGFIHKKIESGGLSCKQAFQTVRAALFEKFKAAPSLRVGFGEFLDAFTVALDEISESKRTIRQTLANCKEQSLIFTEKVIPSDFIAIREHNENHPDRKVVGFVRNIGTPIDHITLICQELGLVSVIMEDLKFDFNRVKNHCHVLVMSVRGRGEGRDLVFNPDQSLLDQFKKEQAVNEFLNQGLSLHEHPPYTKCGKEIMLTYASSQLGKESPIYSQLDVGLLRMELLIDENGRMLREDQLTESFIEYLQLKSPNKVTIRMPDNVKDKAAKLHSGETLILHCDGPSGPEELAGDQILLANPETLFRPHVRAILRAAAVMPNARILFPQVTNHQNAQLLVDFVNAEKATLGIADLNIDIGMMIESQRAATDVEKIVAVEGVKFISIGSNDFTSAILGMDRYSIIEYNGFSMCHSDVIQALDALMRKIDEINSRRSAAEGVVDISICGNMPTNPEFIGVLVGLGFRKFCVETNIEVINKMVAMLEVKECELLVRNILSHSMSPGESVFHEFVFPFLRNLTLSEKAQALLR